MNSSSGMFHHPHEQPLSGIGPLLRRLRGRLSLRDVNRLVGVSSSYLSLVERGVRQPGPNLIKKLASAYNVDLIMLLERAGHASGSHVPIDIELDVERAYRYVLSDPRFRHGTAPDGPLSVGTKRFIVEMYERLTGKRLL